METLANLRSAFKDQLSSSYDEEEIRQLFQLLCLEYLQIPKIQIPLRLHEHILEPQLKIMLQALQELTQGKPIQHILGKAPFYGMDFRVNEHTLIPRPETEELVDLILKQHSTKIPLKLIDIGTGSGCIAISLKKHLAHSQLIAVDISADAIAVAKDNAKSLGADVEFRCLDILEWDLTLWNEQFDVIVSNPPYITQQEKLNMHRNVLDFEPDSALFVEDEHPLLFYDVISSFAQQQLKRNGILYFEVNQYLAEETKVLLLKKGFQHVEVIQDINHAARMIKAWDLML